MWGFIAKAAGWAIAHRNEIGAGIQIWKRLRKNRKESGKSAKDFYLGKGKEVIVEAATEIAEGDE